jgi:hypothetical protein
MCPPAVELCILSVPDTYFTIVAPERKEDIYLNVLQGGANR